MKKLLLMLALGMLSCSSSSQTNTGVYDFEGLMSNQNLAIMNAIAKQYAPDATIYALAGQPLSWGILGLANQVADHTYLIQFTSLNHKMTRVTMFHEMGHIIDAELGRLDFSNGMRWDGQECDFSGEWEDRPWEMSANDWRDCLMYEYENGELEYYDYIGAEFLKAFGVYD